MRTTILPWVGTGDQNHSERRESQGRSANEHQAKSRGGKPGRYGRRPCKNA